jgi:hypothetical protein
MESIPEHNTMGYDDEYYQTNYYADEPLSTAMSVGSTSH